MRNEFADASSFRVATYNIHKGVQGIGPARRLEIHNLGHAIEQLDADIVCLQEVRKMNRQAAARFSRWPEMPQADFLAPEGYTAVYETNAITRHGEHGNALLTRWPVLRKTHQRHLRPPLRAARAAARGDRRRRPRRCMRSWCTWA